MLQMNIDRAETLDLIAAVFEGVERGDGVSLREARVRDNYGGADECRAARQLDTDHWWDQVSEADLAKYGTSLCFFDTNGFRYYLPALMTWDVRTLVLDRGPRSGLQYHLGPRGRMFDCWEYFLTAPQCNSVYWYLRFLIDYGDVSVGTDTLVKAAQNLHELCQASEDETNQ